MKNWRVCALAVLAIVVASCLGVVALGVGIDSADIDRAIGLGRKPAAEREHFHSLYNVRLGDATVMGFEIFSEFRRVVLESEERERLGNRHLDVIDAEALLRPWRRKVSIVAHVRFNPQNVLVSVPDYQLILAGDRGAADVKPIDTLRKPFYGGTTIVGADFEAVFDAASIARSTRTIVLRSDSKQLAAAAFNLSLIE